MFHQARGSLLGISSAIISYKLFLLIAYITVSLDLRFKTG